VTTNEPKRSSGGLPEGISQDDFDRALELLKKDNIRKERIARGEINKPFSLRNTKELILILETFSHLDHIRWNEASNYNLINYCGKDLTADEKLLTHWLCYITDRQMPFERIWAIGGYVISHLVRCYTRESNRDIFDLLNVYIQKRDNHIRLECPFEEPNKLLENYGIVGKSVPFSSRYMPEDLTLIYRTLEVLDKNSQRSLSMFLEVIINDELDHWRAIRRMAATLNKLTYEAAGAVSAADFDKALKRTEKEARELKIDTDLEEELFGRKRLWCSLRDYLKSPVFNEVFVESLTKLKCKYADHWKRTDPKLINALGALELPGDVWNNAEVFRKGLFSPYLCNERESWDMPYTVRRLYKTIIKDHETSFYPEQLDVSFDFVPRMCERSMCDVCLFGNGIESICHQQAGRLCSVVLVACGYRHTCSPNSCDLKKDSVRTFCQSRL
jgi:hypothetical protein